MRSTLFLLVLIGGAMAQNYYPNIMSQNEANVLLRNNYMLGQVLHCLIGVGPCSPQARRAKSLIPEVVRTGCEKCTDQQKEMLKKLFKKASVSFPSEWQRLLDKYDPQGINRARLDYL